MKKIGLLTLALIVLLAAWYWLSQTGDSGDRSGRTEYATQADTLLVSKVIVKRWGQPDIVITKGADGLWNLTEPLASRANQNLAEQIVKGVALLVLDDKVSSRTEMQAKFEIDETQATQLQAFHGGTMVADVYVGKMAPDMEHVYARREGSDDIYTASGGMALSRLRARSIDDFRDHVIAHFDLSAIDSVRVRTLDHEYAIARVDTMSWQARIGKGAYKPAERPVTEGVLRAISGMRASGFASDSTVIDWSKPAATVTVWLLGRDPMTVSLQPIDGAEEYWAKVEGSEFVYKVFASMYAALNRDPQTFFPAS